MNNSIYFNSVYFDAEWGLHHLVRRIIGAVYSGLVSLARHFTKILDFVITPQQVVLENTWTGYATSTTVTVAVDISSSANSYVTVGASINSSAGVTATCTLNGVNVPSLAGGSTVRSCYLFGIIPATTGSQNVVVTLSGSTTCRVIVNQLSGVNQTTPTLATNSTSADSTSVTTSAALTTSLFGLIVDVISNESGTISANDGQTTVTVDGDIRGGYKIPTATTDSPSYSSSSSSPMRISAASFNPA